MKLTRLSTVSATTPTSSSADNPAAQTARWVLSLFVAIVVLQRFSVPFMPVSCLVPLAFLWCYVGFRRGLLQFDSRRMTMWALAMGATAMMFAPQQIFVSSPVISYTSWALIAATWFPATFRLRYRSAQTYARVLDGIIRITSWLSVLSIIFIVSQLVGLPYRDWFSLWVPDFLELKGFIIAYPISYGSALYKSNAWICLEPSFVSLQVGLGVVAGMIRGVSIRRMILLVLGLVSAVSGSGFAVVVVAVIAMLFSGRRRNLLPYLLPMGGVIAAAAATPFGQNILSRLTEFNDANSSTSARALTPYTLLLPDWAAEHAAVLWGIGAGSSQRAVDAAGVPGLLVPTGVKIFYDYGFIGGSVLCLFLFTCYLRVPSRVIMISLVISMWTLQPGLTATPFVLVVVLAATIWAPQPLRRDERADPLFRERVKRTDAGTPSRFLQRPGRHRATPTLAQHQPSKGVGPQHHL